MASGKGEFATQTLVTRKKPEEEEEDHDSDFLDLDASPEPAASSRRAKSKKQEKKKNKNGDSSSAAAAALAIQARGSLLQVSKPWAHVLFDDGGGVETKESLIKTYSLKGTVSIISMILNATNVVSIPLEVSSLMGTNSEWICYVYQVLSICGILSAGAAVYISLILVDHVSLIPSKRIGEYVYENDITIPLLIRPIITFSMGCFISVSVMRLSQIFKGISLAIVLPFVAFFSLVALLSRIRLGNKAKSLMKDIESKQLNHISLPRGYALKHSLGHEEDDDETGSPV